MYEQMPSSSNTTRIDHLFRALHSLLDIGPLLSHLPKSSSSSSPSIVSFAQQNENLSSTNESGQVKAKIEDIIKQLLKIFSTSPPSSPSSSVAQNTVFLKNLYKEVLSAKSVTELGKVLSAAKNGIDKLL